ncbi:GxxExxY protein [Spirosoma aerolatum]|uniref:GxxExxY protein n=1 Tax=Spirosoma aerolatum TaxID=1211326 RepID=UPI002936DABB|nr:GxxExxY protein [Spirosoma aerolatum]
MVENELLRVIFDCALKVHEPLSHDYLSLLMKSACFVLICSLNKKVITELKAVESLTNVHLAQMMTYLRLSGCRLGYWLIQCDTLKK